MNNAAASKNAEDLIYLVSCAVNGESPDKKIIDEMNLPELFDLAMSHSLAAAAAFALETAIKLPDNFREEKFKSVRRTSLYNIERENLFKELENRKIWYVPLKGIVLKECYPKTAMREMKDNDILCDGSRFSEIREIMEGFGFTCTSFGKKHHDRYTKPPKLEFEIHRSLFYSQGNAKLYGYFKDIDKKLVKDSGNSSLFHMTDEDTYLYLICHLNKHYQRKGAGLRYLLDVYVYIKQFGESLDFDYIIAELQKIDLNDFESGIRNLAVKVFTGQALTETESKELSFFIDSSVHGNSDNLWVSRLKNDDSGRSKTKYALSRIFPNSAYLKEHHPFVYRHKAVYPFWVVFRPVKGLLRHRKLMFKEIKGLKSFKKKDNRGKFN